MKKHSQLVAETLELMDRSGLSQMEMAMGCQVNYHWVSRFYRGQYPNPGVLRVETLHNYLVDYMANKTAEEA